MNRLTKTALFVLLNIATFYGLKWYYDTRQVRLVSALLPAVVKVSPVGHRWSEELVMTPLGLDIKKVYRGFGVMGHGSGVFISKDGLILTCAHVVDGTPLVELSLDGQEDKLTPKGYNTAGKLLGYVVGRDLEHDVALIRVISPRKGIKYADIGKSVKKGLSVMTIGFPGPFNKYVTAGIVSGSLYGNIFSDVVVAPGNSGGGVFTINGELVGLAKGMTGPLPIPTYQGFSVLTPLDAIRAIVSKYTGF
jgi:S1-C subfamily serine protease